jgi:MFS family permease
MRGDKMTTGDTAIAGSPAQARSTRKESIRVTAASLVGTTLEFYDHFIFGTAAALVFPKIFFPQTDPFVATLLSLLTYGMAFVARPLGAAIFGTLGDRIGRKFVLVTTLLLMGLATVLIGILPTYAQIGVAAPILLVTLRVIQGVAIGGEWGSAALMVNEFDPTGKRKGFYGSLIQVASPLGVLLANGAFGFMGSITSDAEFLEWGWRVPFLASAVLVVFGYFIRRTVNESPVFLKLEAEQEKVHSPLREVVREHWFPLLLAIGVRVAQGVIWYMFSLFLLIYVPKHLGLSNEIAINLLIWGAVAGLIATPIFGLLLDRYGQRRMLLIAVGMAMVWSFVFFELLATKDPVMIAIASIVGMVCEAALFAPLASFIPQLFIPKVRCTGASLGFQLGVVVGGSLAPGICLYLLDRYHSSLPISLYATAVLVIAGLCVLLASRKA